MSEEATLGDFVDSVDDESSETGGLIDAHHYPKKWSVVDFEKVIGDIRYGTDTKSNSDGDGYPTLRIPNIVEKRITTKKLKYTPLSDEKYKRLKLDRGDILLIRTNGNPDYVGQCAVFDNEIDDCVFASYLIRVRLDEGSALPKFVSEFLNSNLGRQEMSGWISTSAGNHNMGISAINNFSIPVPPLPEQRKIATVLYTVDQAIENAEEIESQLQRVKKGATQKLFTYGLNNEDTQSHHIGDFPQSWEFDKVSNLAEIERGNTPRTSHDEYYGGEIAWVTPDDLSDLNEDGNGKYISDSGRKLTPEGVESSSLTVVEPDSVMFTSRSYGIGRTAICTVPAATNQGITAFECGESLDTEFFYYYLNYIMDYVVSISGGSTFPEISKSATGNIDVPVPGIEEQKEIASLLSQFDEQILHNREVTSQLKRLKRGLMQDLLSGTVRTTNTNIEVPDEIAQHG